MIRAPWPHFDSLCVCMPVVSCQAEAPAEHRLGPCNGLRRLFCTASKPYKPTDIEEVEIVRKRGIDLLHDPLYNKACPSLRHVHGRSLYVISHSSHL